ncbi:membrane protein [Microbacterium endophyticum]|uniref:Membrane protein n=1 Tax=Microbacterium endophyticum TaxID=1526412 RepID=A0A7W4V3K9_9MICO|nr:YihY/virulence factor BrkB family protein [Microbacterium endophyticum]MBB2976191.1 membrane protein [Microbacterium endophyticum]NIK36488.1 membrane protein [Microbacterium endophyticum]
MTESGATTSPSQQSFVARVISWALGRKPVRAFLLYSEHRGVQLADSVTYRALFSVFAAVLLGFSIAGLWLQGNPQAWDALISAVNSVVPGLVGKDKLIDPENLQFTAGLSIAGVISVVALVGAAIGAITSLRIAFRQLGDRMHDDVAFYWVLLRNLALAVGIGAALLASAVATVLGTASISTLLSLIGIQDENPVTTVATKVISLVVVFLLDAAVIAVLFRVLSGLRPSVRALWPGAILGGIGLLALQELSGLFVRGAGSNPLLASFASLIALLLWINLSSQVILIAASYIITGVEDEADRAYSRQRAKTFAERRVNRAQKVVILATEELRQARAAEISESQRA